jgi:hypothetical protein
MQRPLSTTPRSRKLRVFLAYVLQIQLLAGLVKDTKGRITGQQKDTQ